MRIDSIFAVVTTADMDRSEAFYAALFGRDPDDRPMDGLIQWRVPAGAGLQVVADSDRAGTAFVTIITPAMDAARQALSGRGLGLGGDIAGDFGALAQIADPDGNVVTLAEPPRGMGG